jgi:hypothetical protein
MQLDGFTTELGTCAQIVPTVGPHPVRADRCEALAARVRADLDRQIANHEAASLGQYARLGIPDGMSATCVTVHAKNAGHWPDKVALVSVEFAGPAGPCPIEVESDGAIKAFVFSSERPWVPCVERSTWRASPDTGEALLLVPDRGRRYPWCRSGPGRDGDRLVCGGDAAEVTDQSRRELVVAVLAPVRHPGGSHGDLARGPEVYGLRVAALGSASRRWGTEHGETFAHAWSPATRRGRCSQPGRA